MAATMLTKHSSSTERNDRIVMCGGGSGIVLKQFPSQAHEQARCSIWLDATRAVAHLRQGPGAVLQPECLADQAAVCGAWGFTSEWDMEGRFIQTSRGHCPRGRRSIVYVMHCTHREDV
jgi:hypothetical protein